MNAKVNDEVNYEFVNHRKNVGCLIGEELMRITDVNSEFYDKEFDEGIRQLKPDWIEYLATSSKNS